MEVFSRLYTKVGIVSQSVFSASHITQNELSKKANISTSTARQALKGHTISKKTADSISKVLKNKKLFIPLNDDATLSGQTIAKYHRLLSSMLTSAVQWQVIPDNPCKRVKPPHVEYKEAAVLDEIQATALTNCLQTETLNNKTAVILILYTGLRRGELCGLDWNDIDLTNGIIQINKELLYTPSKGLYEDTTKTKKSNRTIYIPQEVTQLLKELQLEQNKKRLMYGDQWQESGKVFTSNNGSELRPDSFYSWFKKFINKYNLPNIHPHTLRHTSATLLITGGVNIATVSSRLGHASKTTTLNIYTHAIKSADEAAAQKLHDIFNKTKENKAI